MGVPALLMQFPLHELVDHGADIGAGDGNGNFAARVASRNLELGGSVCERSGPVNHDTVGLRTNVPVTGRAKCAKGKLRVQSKLG
jgi:hypothetical protein